MKFMKTKVAAGVVAVGMVASMGTVFAATDAGGQLHNWYNTASSAVISTIKGDFASYKSGQLSAHAGKVDGAITKARQDIRDAGNAQITKVNSSINNQVTAYTNQLGSAQSEIAAAMPAAFDAFVSSTNAATDSEVAGIGAQNKTDIQNAIRNHKGVYLDRLNTAAATTQDAAKKTLNDKIADVKKQLNDLLAGEQTTATQEIKGHLDSQLAALEAELAVLTKAGVDEAKTAIEARGTALVTASLDELDGIVDSIDN